MKNFNIFRNEFKKEGEKTPDYKIMVTLAEGEKMTEAGGCWIKDGKNGKFFSCKLNDVYVDHTKNIARKGFELNLSPSNGNHMPEIKEEVVEDKSQVPF